MDLEYIGNIAECCLWLTIAVILFISSFRVAPPFLRLTRILSATFVLFGISDYIEAHTGAWWTPFWLLLLKAGCILVFIWGALSYRRISKGLGT